MLINIKIDLNNEIYWLIFHFIWNNIPNYLSLGLASVFFDKNFVDNINKYDFLIISSKKAHKSVHKIYQ